MITVEAQGNKIIVFSENGKYEWITTFRPYFYIPDEKGTYISLFGKKLKKIVMEHPKEVGFEREKYHQHYEADILYDNRYIIDTYDEIPKQFIHKLYLDIETEVDESGFPNIELAKQKILSISTYSNETKKYYTFYITKQINENPNHIYYHFNKEEEMLNSFLDFIKNKNPDMLIAWNLDKFDLPYIINRLKNLKLNTTQLCRLGRNIYETKFGQIKLFGRICADLLLYYKHISQGQRESYSLEYISQYELKEGKEKYEGSIKDLPYNNPQKFIEYNIRDVELLILLDEKLHIIDYFDEIRRYAKCKFEDVIYNSKVVDCLFLSFCKGKFCLPSRNYATKKKRFKGAFVHEPPKGVFKNIAVFDLKSLYPSTILTCNLSPETITEEKTNTISVVGYNYIKPSQTLGIIPQMILKLLEERNKFKSLMNNYEQNSQEYKSYDLIQYAVKVLANSVYGVLGYSTFRLFDIRIAETITKFGQEIIKYTISISNEKNHKVIYGDTDSIFIETNNKSYNELLLLSKEISNSYKTFTNMFGIEKSYLELEFEKVYEAIFFKEKISGKKVKKRYAGILIYKNIPLKEPKLDITGFESKRSDTPEILREFQKNLFIKILKNPVKSEIKQFISDFKLKFYNLKSELGIPCGLWKDINSSNAVHLRASRISNERHGTKFQAGDKIKWLYVSICPSQFTHENIIAFSTELYDGYSIDYDKMWNNLVEKKVNEIFHSLGWDKDKSASLFSFTEKNNTKENKKIILPKESNNNKVNQNKSSSWW